MTDVRLFVLVSLTIIAATFLFAIPNHAQAKISFCAEGNDTFQCFIKENDCKAFSENNPGTECVRSKS